MLSMCCDLDCCVVRPVMTSDICDPIWLPRLHDSYQGCQIWYFGYQIAEIWYFREAFGTLVSLVLCLVFWARWAKSLVLWQKSCIFALFDVISNLISAQKIFFEKKFEDFFKIQNKLFNKTDEFLEKNGGKN